MQRIQQLLKLASVALIVGGLLSTTMPASGLITGSAHDFSGQAWNGSGEICITCHTPHNALGTLVPLWNHNTTVATFLMYDGTVSATFDAAASVTQPTGVSLACLSCHDGTVGLDAFGGSSGVPTYITGPDLLDTDLRNDHPISFDYTISDANDLEIQDQATVEAAGLQMFSNEMQCGTCHDVHNTVSVGNASLLIIDNAASALCLTCHLK